MIQDSLITSKEDLFAGRYKIEKLLGSGAAGKVYLATDKLLEGEHVALKVLSSQHLKDETQVKRFLREASLTRRVTHPNVVRTYDVGNHKNILFLSMEYVEGVNLKEYISEQPLPIEKALRFVADIGKGLVAIHGAEIIHRDLKLNNVLITKNETVKIADFGVAKHTLSSLTMQEDLIGSATHMAPEVWKSGDEISNASDVYALGIIAYELLTGILPFEGATVMELMWKHTHQEPTTPSAIIPEVPSWVDNLILSMLTKDQKKRIQSVEEVIRTIENCLAQQPETADPLSATSELKVAPSISSVGYERTNRQLEPQSLLWDPIMVEPSDSSHISLVDEPCSPTRKTKPILKALKTFTPFLKPLALLSVLVLSVVTVGAELETLLSNAADALRSKDHATVTANPVIELFLIAGLSSLPILLLSIIFNREISFKLWASTFVKLVALYAFIALCLSRIVVANGYFIGYTSLRGTMFALAGMQLSDLWYFTNLIPILPDLSDFIVGVSKGAASQAQQTPLYVIAVVAVATLFQLLLLTTIISRNIFDRDDKLIVLTNIFVSFLLTCLVSLETIYSKQIAEFLGWSLKKQAVVFGFKQQLSEFAFNIGAIHWCIFFIGTVGIILWQQSREDKNRN